MRLSATVSWSLQGERNEDALIAKLWSSQAVTKRFLHTGLTQWPAVAPQTAKWMRFWKGTIPHGPKPASVIVGIWNPIKGRVLRQKPSICILGRPPAAGSVSSEWNDWTVPTPFCVGYNLQHNTLSFSQRPIGHQAFMSSSTVWIWCWKAAQKGWTCSISSYSNTTNSLYSKRKKAINCLNHPPCFLLLKNLHGWDSQTIKWLRLDVPVNHIKLRWTLGLHESAWNLLMIQVRSCSLNHGVRHYVTADVSIRQWGSGVEVQLQTTSRPARMSGPIPELKIMGNR